MKVSLKVMFSAMVACLPLASQATATFPTGQVRIVVPFPPGGIADNLARGIADRLTARLGQPVLVENRPGGNTVIAAQAVAWAKPDGHTLLMATDATLSVLPLIYDKLPFDPQKDFQPVVPVAQATPFLVVSSEVPATTVDELVKLTAAKPGRLSYGSQGQGSNGHFSGELLKQHAKVDITHVPYKGLADAIGALVGNHTSMTFANVYPMIPHVESGRLRLLAYMGEERSSRYPDIPTIAEVGYPGLESVAWFGLVAPSGTPQTVADTLASEISAIVGDPDFRERFITGAGLEPVSISTPEAFAEYLARDRQKYEDRVRQTGIKMG
ncbi:MAG: Bug family tripartite tricarboxylate transporter substrate binding protein [Pigmentiphaga sp.]